MKYVILMSSPDGVWEALDEAEQAEIVAAHETFMHDLQAAGKYVCSYRLGEPGAARTVRRDAGGALSLTPGPPDPKEVIGGFYVIEAESMEEALEWGRRSRFTEGANEVRALWA